MIKTYKLKDYEKLLFSKQNYALKKYNKTISTNYFDCKDFIIEILDSEFITIDCDKFKKVVKEYYKKCKDIEV